MRRIVDGVAAAHGVSAEVDYSRSFEPVVNTPEETALATEVARRVPGASVDSVFGRVGFSEDFGQMLDRTRGCMVLLGIGDATATQLHSPTYDFDDAAIPYGVEYWVRLTEEVLPP